MVAEPGADVRICPLTCGLTGIAVVRQVSRSTVSCLANTG